MTISREIYLAWKEQPILHDEDMWAGRYKTYGEMWVGEGYQIEEDNTMTKAKYIGCTHDGWQHTELHYEYRGRTYIVTKHNNGYMGESLTKQHKQAQHDIDEAIANENKPHEEWRYEGSGQEGFDLFWEFAEGE